VATICPWGNLYTGEKHITLVELAVGSIKYIGLNLKKSSPLLITKYTSGAMPFFLVIFFYSSFLNKLHL
jgi:hypothetical protein